MAARAASRRALSRAVLPMGVAQGVALAIISSWPDRSLRPPRCTR